MKLEAEVHVINTKKPLIAGQCIPIDISMDEFTDGDDLIKAVENALWENYGVDMFNDVDFKIMNYSELCDKISY